MIFVLLPGLRSDVVVVVVDVVVVVVVVVVVADFVGCC